MPLVIKSVRSLRSSVCKVREAAGGGNGFGVVAGLHEAYGMLRHRLCVWGLFLGLCEAWHPAEDVAMRLRQPHSALATAVRAALVCHRQALLRATC